MAFSIDRTTVLRSPARLAYGGRTFQSKGDIVITPVIARSRIATAAFGVIDATRATDRMFRITFTPAGVFADVSVLLASLALPLGSSIIGADDKPMVLHTRVGGEKITFTNVAITKLPVVTLSAGETLWGEVECMAILGKNADPSNLSSYVVYSTESYPGDAGFGAASIPTSAYEAAWGDTAPWDAFQTRAGWKITPQITTQPESADALGTFDYKITDMEVTAVAQPLNITAAQAVAKMGFSGSMGSSRLGAAEDLVITGGGLVMTINKALIDQGPMNYGAAPIIGDMTWKATRSFTSGAVDPILTFED
jgi:hypothetical protein